MRPGVVTPMTLAELLDEMLACKAVAFGLALAREAASPCSAEEVSAVARLNDLWQRASGCIESAPERGVVRHRGRFYVAVAGEIVSFAEGDVADSWAVEVSD